MTQTTHRTDHQMKAAINEELEWTANVQADHIGVSLIDGAATLSGEVASYPEKTAAVRAVLRVRGVTSVADEIVVQNTWGEHQDADIARAAGAALDASVVLPTGAVKATVHDHHVELSGSVPWKYQRDAADELVSSVPGVRSLHNAIVLCPSLPLAAAQARDGIRAALLRNAQIDATQIEVTSAGTEIDLSGTVTSWAELRQAEHAAWATPGVTKVHNWLRVVG